MLLALALATLLTQGGCAWLRSWHVAQEPPPHVLPPGAGLEQVIAAVNQNNGRIQALFSSSATLSGQGYPTLRTQFAFQRPRNFRLRAETGITGPEVDLGSNDQIFWFWIKRNQPPALYVCRHDQFPTSQARQTIPIDPNWLIEALGTVVIDPALPHQGPYPGPGNRIQIRTVCNTPEGTNLRVTIIDAVSAWVMEQQMWDAAGRLRARSVAEGYRRDPRSGLYIPTAVRVECPAAQFAMRIDLGAAEVNQLQGNPAELWSLPRYPGYPLVDLGNPSMPSYPPPGMAAQR